MTKKVPETAHNKHDTIQVHNYNSTETVAVPVINNIFLWSICYAMNIILHA